VFFKLLPLLIIYFQRLTLTIRGKERAQVNLVLCDSELEKDGNCKIALRLTPLSFIFKMGAILNLN